MTQPAPKANPASTTLPVAEDVRAARTLPPLSLATPARRRRVGCAHRRGPSGGHSPPYGQGSFHYPHHDPRFLVALVVDALRRLAEVLRLGGVNVGEGLRVAVGEREPGTLHLHHDLVPGPEGVAGVRQRE